MRYILILALYMGLFVFLRSLSLAMTYVSICGYRDKECIERIRQQQKACDMLNAAYHILVMMIAISISAGTILRMFNVDLLLTFDIVSLAVIFTCYVIFFILRFKLEDKYDLRNFYNDMVNYRLHQKVVTKDNDCEVSFIRSYEKTTKHKLFVNLWCCVYVIYLFLYQ